MIFYFQIRQTIWSSSQSSTHLCLFQKSLVVKLAHKQILLRPNGDECSCLEKWLFSDRRYVRTTITSNCTQLHALALQEAIECYSTTE